MGTNKMREQFEADLVEEMCRRGGEGFRSTVLYSLSQKKPDGDYQHITESLAWWAWQTSREAVVIALPRDLNLRSPTEVRDMIRHHIEAQGLKVSP